MGPMVWRVLSAAAAMGAAAVANQVITRGWSAVAGKPAPTDPTNPEEVTWKEALLFAALTGLVVQAARVMATRKAAQYYYKSAGHLPAPFVKIEQDLKD